MSTEQHRYSIDGLIFMARTHRKVIDYYQFVLAQLNPSEDERSQIARRISREERALVIIGQLAGLRTRTQTSDDLPVDLTALETAIEEHEGAAEIQ